MRGACFVLLVGDGVSGRPPLVGYGHHHACAFKAWHCPLSSSQTTPWVFVYIFVYVCTWLYTVQLPCFTTLLYSCHVSPHCFHTCTHQHTVVLQYIYFDNGSQTRHKPENKWNPERKDLSVQASIAWWAVFYNILYCLYRYLVVEYALYVLYVGWNANIQ